MITTRLYFIDSYQFKAQAVILGSGKDDVGPYVILDQTIFHPQGGGQPSDQGELVGKMGSIPIHKVKAVEEEIRHYTSFEDNSWVGEEVQCTIDPKMRLYHAKLHSGGHLVSNIVEKLYPHLKPIKGHHFPDSSYVEFKASKGTTQDISLELIQQDLEQAIQEDLSITISQVNPDQLKEFCPDLGYEIKSAEKIRLSRIGEFPHSPCGGTHVKTLQDLKGLTVTKYKIKEGTLKISYVLAI